MQEGVETKDEILRTLAASGFDFSPSQLARLHRARAISHVGSPGLGRARGRASLYTRGTTEQVLRLAALASRERRLPERAWLSWWLYGGPLSLAAEQFMRSRANDLDAKLDLVRALARGETVKIDVKSWTLEDVYRASEEERLQGVLGKARARAGKKRFSSVMAFFVGLISGDFKGFPVDTVSGSNESEARLIELALGLSRARSDSLLDAQRWLQGGLESDFVILAERLKRLSFREAATTPGAVLNVARIEVKALSECVSAAAAGFDAVFGVGAFSYRELAEALVLDDYEAQVFAVLAWSYLGRDRALREGMTQVIAGRAQAKTINQMLATLGALRDGIPAFRDILAPQRLAEALRDAEAAQRFQDEVFVLRSQHAAEITALLGDGGRVSD